MPLPMDSTPIIPPGTPASGGELAVDGSGRVCYYNATLGRVVPLVDETEVAVFSWKGPLSVMTGVAGYPIDFDGSIVAVRARLTTAPTGSGSTIADLKKNGTSTYTTTANRPTWAAGSNGGLATLPNTLTVTAGDILTWDILQIAGTTPGSDVTIKTYLRRT